MAWTLGELSKLETDVLRKSIIDTMLMESNLLELCPWETIGQLSTGVVMIQDLPSVGFRAINAGYEESTGHFKHKVEHISLLGGYIDTDKALARAKNTIADARAIQQTMMVRSMTYEFNDKFINGNPETAGNALEFKGLVGRVDDINADGYTDQKVQHNVTHVSETDAKMHDFIDKLDQCIYSIKGHKPDYALMNQQTLLWLRSILRRLKLLDVTKDMFDRQVDVYQGVRLIDVGLKRDQSTQIIGNAETATGGLTSGDRSSIYFIKFGVGDMTWGIQQYPLEAEDLGLMKEKPVYRTMVDWPLGLATVDPRSLVRLYGFKFTA